MVSRGRGQITLREERDGADARFLWAYLGDDGSLHIDGQDLGPGTAAVSDDGEYEWFSTIGASDIPRLMELLGANSKDDVLQTLVAHYSGTNSYELERVLREGNIPVQRFIY